MSIEKRRYSALDSLRGIAALDVVLAHIFSFVSAPALAWWIRFTPLRVLEGARSPVIFFFVLSGFVLTLSLVGGNGLAYRPFVVRRFCRIYLPFAAAILVAAALVAILHPRYISAFWATKGNWYDGSLPTVAGHLFMIGTDRLLNLNGPAWSLVHEMRISMIMPVLVGLVIWAPTRSTIALMCASSFAYIGLFWIGEADGFYGGHSFGGSLLMTVYYVAPFAFGILLAVYLDRLLPWFAHLGLIGWLPLIGAVGIMHFKLNTISFDLLNSAASAWLIVSVLAQPRVRAFFEHGLFLWLGQISYSLYLFHLLVFLTLAHTIGTRVSAPLFAGLAILLSLLVAHLANRYIERPAMSLGRRLSSKVGRSELAAA